MWQNQGMKKIIRKKRKGDVIQVTHSVMQDIIAATNKPITPPKKKQ
jgi:hypothetical protein